MVAVLYGGEFQSFIFFGKNEYFADVDSIKCFAIEMPRMKQNWLEISNWHG